MKKQWTISALAFVLLSPMLAAGAQEDKKKKEKKKPDTYTAVAQGIRGAVGGRSISLTFRVTEWTSDQEVLELADLLREGGVDALRRKLEKRRVGRIAPSGSVGADLAVARVIEGEDGTRLIRLITARNMPFFELYYAGRSTDYPFGWFEFVLNEKGKGQGGVIVAARPRFNKEGVLEVESYGLQPIRLVNVRDRTKKKKK